MSEQKKEEIAAELTRVSSVLSRKCQSDAVARCALGASPDESTADAARRIVQETARLRERVAELEYALKRLYKHTRVYGGPSIDKDNRRAKALLSTPNQEAGK